MINASYMLSTCELKYLHFFITVVLIVKKDFSCNGK